MSAVALTHSAVISGRCCAWCGKKFPGLPVRAYERVGMIETKHGGPRVYQLGDRDSNQLCFNRKPV